MSKPSETSFLLAVDEALTHLYVAKRELKRNKVAREEFGERLEGLIEDMEREATTSEEPDLVAHSPTKD